MSAVLFSQPWVDAWKEKINGSEAYAKVAREWHGGVGLVVDAEGNEPLAILLELDGGVCREARRVDLARVDKAEHVLRAPEPIWLTLMRDNKDPVWALMSGKLKLARGSMTALLPFTAAARELMATARDVDLDALGPEPVSPPGEPEVETSAQSPSSASRSAYRSTGPAGLDRDSPPMRLWEKAKRRGIWNPTDADLEQDRADWAELAGDERDLLKRLTSLFLAGEEAVTLDLLPLIQAVAGEGRLEEELYLTSFLWEEAKHVDAFSRFFDDIAGERFELERYHTPSYRTLFYEELPAALSRLRSDVSPEALAEASVTYHMIVEGVLAETGYHGYYTVLDTRDILPGMRGLIANIQSDEARHLAYGVFLLSRLVAEHGESVWQVIESRMERLAPVALNVVDEAFAPYDPVPFNLSPAVFAEFAQDQFRRRFSRIEKARRQSLGEVYRTNAEAVPAG